MWREWKRERVERKNVNELWIRRLVRIKERVLEDVWRRGLLGYGCFFGHPIRMIALKEWMDNCKNVVFQFKTLPPLFLFFKRYGEIHVYIQ